MKKKRLYPHLFIIIIVLVSFIGFVWTPYDADQMNIALKNASPSFAHPFGNDSFGRDVLSRVISGMSTSVLIGISIVAIGSFFGVLIGAITGYFGGWLDEVLMRLNDTLSVFPSILMGLIFVSVFGSGKTMIILVLGILFIPSIARVTRSEYVKQKSLDYVKNAKILGASNSSILFRHMLPNMKSILLPTFAIAFNNAILAEASMSFLGLGVQPPESSLGRMISESTGQLATAPWTVLFPGFIMVCIIISFGMIGGEE